MKTLGKRRGLLLALSMALVLIFGMSAYASSDDNSLYALGITTEGVTVEPEFTYSTWEYNVVVPAGTTSLELSPTPSSENASITDISGTTIGEDGTTTVYITCTSQSGAPFTYTLHVTSAAAEVQTEAPTEKQTEPQTEAETEPETEDSQYVKVDKNTIQEAENTITDLKGEITGYRETVSLYTKIMYGLIALSVILLFIVINLILKGNDMKAELKDYRSYGYAPGKKSGKAPAKQNARPNAKEPAQKEAPQMKKSRPVSEEAQDVKRKVRPEKPQKANQSAVKAPQEAPAASQRKVNKASYQKDQSLDVAPQSSKKSRQLPEYEEENVVRQAAKASKAEDEAQRQMAAEKRQEETAAKAAARRGADNGEGKKNVRIDMIDL